MAYNNNSYSRIRENEAKLAAYYTDSDHCRTLEKLFIFPEQEVCVLEPSIGDGRAVIEITGAAKRPNIKIFGVELNQKVAEKTKEDPHVNAVLKADFTNGVIIRNNSFSFCFANPPYMAEKSDDGKENIRLEQVFLEKISNYLCMDAILVWVVPEKSFFEEGHLRLWSKFFDTICFYRFRPKEYAKYKQIVLIGKKIGKREVTKQMLLDLSEQVRKNLIELPDVLEPCIHVPPSSSSEIDLFTTKEFPEADAYQYLARHGIPEDVLAVFDQKASQPKFADTKLKRPPIPLKKDSLYLLATSGAGQGLTGSIETKDLHLQRGVAEVVEDTRYNSTDDPEDSGTLTVTTHTAISMHIVENDGTITKLA